MTALVPRSIVVDGVRLDNYAYLITTRNGWDNAPGLAGENVKVPGRDGEIWRAKDYEPSSMVLELMIDGKDADGNVPSGYTAETKFRANLDALLAIFGKRTGLITVDKEIEDGSVRRNYAEVGAVIAPTYFDGNTIAMLTVELIFPDPLWRSTTTVTATGSGTATIALSALAGITAPISDAVITIAGAGTNPKVTDSVSGSWIALTGSLSGTWEINCKAFTSKVGGSSVIATTTFNPGPRFLSLTPNGSLIPSLVLSGFTSASVSVTAYKRFLA